MTPFQAVKLLFVVGVICAFVGRFLVYVTAYDRGVSFSTYRRLFARASLPHQDLSHTEWIAVALYVIWFFAFCMSGLLWSTL